MIPSILVLLLQVAPAAPPAAAAPGGERVDILAAPCANASNDGGDVVVCGRPDTLAPRLPLARFRGVPDHAVPSNPDMSAAVALNGPGIGTECGAYGENCPIAGGGSSYISPLSVAAAAVKGVKNAFSTRKYKNRGVAIPMDDAPVDVSGKVLP